MDISNAVSLAVPFTARWEQFRASPYWDVNGYAIGYGNHYYSDGSPVGQDDEPIDEPTARWLLGFTLNQVGNTIGPMLQVPISDSMLAGLLDLGYNWSPGNVGNSVLLQLINQGAPADQVTAQWEKTAVTAGGVPNSDLVTRRAQEAALAYSDTNSGLGAVALGLAAVFIIGFIYFSSRKH